MLSNLRTAFDTFPAVGCLVMLASSVICSRFCWLTIGIQGNSDPFDRHLFFRKVYDLFKPENSVATIPDKFP